MNVPPSSEDRVALLANVSQVSDLASSGNTSSSGSRHFTILYRSQSLQNIYLQITSEGGGVFMCLPELCYVA